MVGLSSSLCASVIVFLNEMGVSPDGCLHLFSWSKYRGICWAGHHNVEGDPGSFMKGEDILCSKSYK